MNIDKFELRKLKVEASGKTTISYRRMISEGSASYADDVEVVSPRVPHPDLTQALEALVPLLAESNELYIHRDLTNISPAQREKMEDKILQRALNVWDAKINESVEVSGVSLQGDIETGSCVITGKRRVHNTAVAMNSPKISFNGDSFGIETAVQDAVKKINMEVYEYVFNKKSAQQEIPFKEEEGKTEKQEEELAEA